MNLNLSTLFYEKFISVLKVFARKENLITHTCITQKRDCHFECPYCQKTFMQKKYLKRHIARHNGMFHKNNAVLILFILEDIF